MRQLPKLLRKSLSTLKVDLGSENGKLCRLLSTSSVQPSSENPFKRTINIFKNDLKDIFKIATFKSTEMVEYTPDHCDVLVVGGGVIACSIAFWLKHRALEGLNVVVLEKDVNALLLEDDNPAKIEYLQSNNLLGESGLRQQYSLEENIQLSLASADFMRNIKEYLSVKGEEPPDILYSPAGYLFLANEQSAEYLMENFELQCKIGAKVELLTPDKLKQRYPWVNTEGIKIASHGLEKEGWFDPLRLQIAFKKKARQLGAHFIVGEIKEFEQTPDDSNSVKLAFPKYNHAIVELPDGTRKKMTFSIMIIAAGGVSNELHKLLKFEQSRTADLPVLPKKRYEFTFNCGEDSVLISPVVIDPTGLYIRREGLLGDYVCGISPPEEKEPPANNLIMDNQYFHDVIWPQVKFRIPSLSSGKLLGGTVGFFDVNVFDENPIIGPHPKLENIFLATGFGGRGAQQAPAIGRAIMELIADSSYQTIDLKKLEFSRYFEDERLFETNIL